MTTAVQRRRGTATEHSSFTGLEGELSVNTTNESVHVHDGSTAGGFELARADASNIVATSIDINGGTIDGTTIGASSASTGAFTTLTATGLDVTGIVTASAATPSFILSETDRTDENTQLLNASGDFRIRTRSDDGATNTDRFRIDHATGDISFYEDTGTTAKLFWDASAERLGIGTSSPDTKLTVADDTADQIKIGDTTDTNFWSLRAGTNFIVKDNDVEKVRIDSSGNVGIGTTSPTEKLHLNGTALMFGARMSSNNGSTYWDVKRDISTGHFHIADDSLGNVLTIRQDSGNVGIGTSSPAESIHTTGNIRLGDSAPAELYSNSSELRFGVDKNNDNGTSNITFYVDNSEKVRIDSSGRVGIGTSSPSVPVHVYKSQAFPTIVAKFENPADEAIVEIKSKNTDLGVLQFADTEDANVGAVQYSHSDNSMRFKTNDSERMNIDSSGNVGIGTSSPSEKLQVEGTVSATGMKIGANGTDINSTFLGASSLIAFKCNGTERARIDSSGKLLVGKTAYNADDIGVALHPTGTSWFSATNDYALGVNRNGTDGILINFLNDASACGNISCSGTSVSLNSASDQRLKENIADADDAGSKIDAIQVRQFDWKKDGIHQDFGFIAQELQTVAPEAVYTPENEEEMMGVDYSKLVPMLIKEIQSLRNRVAQLEE